MTTITVYLLLLVTAPSPAALAPPFATYEDCDTVKQALNRPGLACVPAKVLRPVVAS